MEQMSGYGYVSKVGAKHRLLAMLGEKAVVLMWFSMGRDGSFVFGPHVKPVNGVSTGSLSAGDTVLYQDLQFRAPGDNPSKVTFHSSGCIHFGGTRAFRPPFLEQGSRTEKLCEIHFARPRADDLKGRNEIRATDIVTQFSLREDTPYLCHVYYSVGNTHQIHDPAEGWSTFIRYTGLERVGAATIEIMLRPKLGSEWPLHHLLVAQAIPDENRAPEGSSSPDTVRTQRKTPQPD